MSFIEEEKEQQKNDTLSQGISISFAFHVLAIAFFTVKAAFFPSQQIDFSQAIRVDMIALPDKEPPKAVTPAITEEAKPALPDKEKAPSNPPLEPVKALTKKADDAIALEKVKNKQQSAIEKLKALAALDKIKQEAAEEERRKAAAARGKKDDGTQKIKGNILSPGSSITGLAKLQHDSYAADLDSHIKQQWALPEWLAKRDLRAQVRVQIDSHGNILGRKIIKSSGNPSYDDEVLATIDRAAPFPAPPEKFLAIVSIDGILIGFPE